ncbi:hypothetical protein [Paraburkholderia humisilvae]|uniref:Uncharacterized protein n=1 Tax=Paraburkholderia humisilvae TaxID=627669 RepID=A0A6J5EZN7_9BURK|nr:hypothetical protein [Paraburkholderia humisilvae]CAB3772070.1 hypothetical protein LMG29542_06787 [Paraburkholderia humisilvae]
MRTIWLVTAVTMVAVALTQYGCVKNDGDQYVGTWKRVSENGWFEVEINRNGSVDNFYVSHKVPNLGAESAADKWLTVREPAAILDGKMVVSGAVPYVVTVDKASGHLVVPGAEFVRTK